MANDIELEDFSKQRVEAREKTGSSEGSAQPQPPNDTHHDNTISNWAWASAALLSFTSVILLVFPRFLLFLAASTESSGRSLSPLESFLSVQLAFVLLVLALALVLCIPSDDPLEQQLRSRGHPLLGPVIAVSLSSSFVSYNSSLVGSLSFVACALGCTIGLWGLWAALFEGTSSVSKKTGADKHTSAFLFGNKSAASSQKKEWRKQNAK